MSTVPANVVTPERQRQKDLTVLAVQDAIHSLREVLGRYVGEKSTPIYTTIADNNGDWPQIEDDLHIAALAAIAAAKKMDAEWRGAFRRDIEARVFASDVVPMPERRAEHVADRNEHRLGSFELLGRR